MSQFFTSGGQSIGDSTSASVLPVNIQELISFRIDCFDLLAVLGALKSLLQHHNSKASILQTITLTRQIFVGKVILKERGNFKFF